MDLNALNQNTNRLIQNTTRVISFLKEFTVDDAKDVSMTYVNEDGSESTKSFSNIAKMVEDSNTSNDGRVAEADNALKLEGKSLDEVVNMSSASDTPEGLYCHIANGAIPNLTIGSGTQKGETDTIHTFAEAGTYEICYMNNYSLINNSGAKDGYQLLLNINGYKERKINLVSNSNNSDTTYSSLSIAALITVDAGNRFTIAVVNTSHSNHSIQTYNKYFHIKRKV